MWDVEVDKKLIVFVVVENNVSFEVENKFVRGECAE